jgi:hypothetical protein
LVDAMAELMVCLKADEWVVSKVDDLVELLVE